MHRSSPRPTVPSEMSRVSVGIVCALLGTYLGCAGAPVPCAEVPAPPASSAAPSSVTASSQPAPPATGVIHFDIPRAGSGRALAPPAVPPPPGTPDLPSARTHDDLATVAHVRLTGDGKIRLRDEEIDVPRILVEARLLLRADPEVRVVIQADRNVSYGRVIEVMDSLRQAGITRIAFAVQVAPP